MIVDLSQLLFRFIQSIVQIATYDIPIKWLTI